MYDWAATGRLWSCLQHSSVCKSGKCTESLRDDLDLEICLWIMAVRYWEMVVKTEEEVGNSMRSVGRKYIAPVYLVYVSTFGTAKLLELLEYLGWFQIFICCLVSNCSWHVYM